MTGQVAEQPDLFEALAEVAGSMRPGAREARRTIRKAIAACAARHDGKVHIAWFRRDLPDWIDPHQIGAVVAGLHASGHLESTGDYLPNGGPSGNARKPALVRVLVKAINEKDFEE